jgi:hypothetical protein
MGSSRRPFRTERVMSEPERPQKEFHHVGLRAMEPQPNEDYIPLTRVYVTDPRQHPNKIEYLRYEPETHLPEDFKNSPHIAYRVEDIRPHIAGKDVVLLFEVGEPPFAKVAFTREEGVYYEYMEFKPGRQWFKD